MAEEAQFAANTDGLDFWPVSRLGSMMRPIFAVILSIRVETNDIGAVLDQNLGAEGEMSEIREENFEARVLALESNLRRNSVC